MVICTQIIIRNYYKKKKNQKRVFKFLREKNRFLGDFFFVYKHRYTSWLTTSDINSVLHGDLNNFNMLNSIIQSKAYNKDTKNNNNYNGNNISSSASRRHYINISIDSLTSSNNTENKINIISTIVSCESAKIV